MKLSRYIHVVYDENFTLLFNTMNSCLVELPAVTNSKEGPPLEKLTENEINYLTENDFFIDDQQAIERFLEIPEPEFLNVIVSLTEKCNLNCRYCYENDITVRATMSKDTIDKIIQYINQVISIHPNIEEIHFDLIGGEPLLAVDILEYLVSQMKSMKDVQIYYLLETNGTLFTKYVQNIFKDTNFTAHITLSSPEDHNKMRPFSKGVNTNTYDHIVKNLIAAESFFNQPNHNLALRYNAHRGNINSYDEFVLNIKRLLPYSFSIEIAPVVDYEYNKTSDALTIKEYSNWYLPKYFSDKERDYSSDEFLLPSLHYRQCIGYQKNNIKIHADGTLGLCNAWVKGNRCGSIDMLLDGVNKESIFPHCATTVQLDVECRECEFLFLCGGKRICRCDNQCQFIDIDIDDYLISFAKEERR